MSKNIVMIVTSVLIFCLSQATFAGDAANGKKLYEKSCHGCHDTRVHTRQNRIVHTYEDLFNRVKFCDNAAKAGFKASELNDVTDYLNDTFYKFIKS
jgi:cytochrome c2